MKYNARYSIPVYLSKSRTDHQYTSLKAKSYSNDSKLSKAVFTSTAEKIELRLIIITYSFIRR